MTRKTQISIDIPEILVFPIRQILKGMQHALIQSRQPRRSEKVVLLPVLIGKMPAHEDDCEDEEDVATHVCCESDEIAWRVVGEEDLWS